MEYNGQLYKKGGAFEYSTVKTVVFNRLTRIFFRFSCSKEGVEIERVYRNWKKHHLHNLRVAKEEARSRVGAWKQENHMKLEETAR